MPIATITVVHTPACHFCADAHEALDEVAREFSVQVELVPGDSDAGQALLQEHRPALFPLVLVDGAYFSQGRLPRRKLRSRLAGRVVVGTS